MNSRTKTVGILLFTIVLGCVVASGCGQDKENGSASVDHGDSTAQKNEDSLHGLHDGYWCVEHGVPEEVCGRCDTTLAAKFQEDGDWCFEHNRPESQCFIHHPEYEEKFIAQYEAKFGKKPPARTED